MGKPVQQSHCQPLLQGIRQPLPQCQQSLRRPLLCFLMAFLTVMNLSASAAEIQTNQLYEGGCPS